MALPCSSSGMVGVGNEKRGTDVVVELAQLDVSALAPSLYRTDLGARLWAAPAERKSHVGTRWYIEWASLLLVYVGLARLKSLLVVYVE